jgi:hypothetical protein
MVRKVGMGNLQEFLQRRMIVRVVQMVKKLVVEESSGTVVVVVMVVAVVESPMKHSSRAVAIVMVAMAVEVAAALDLLEARGKIEAEKESPAGLGKPEKAEDYMWGVAHRRHQVVCSLNEWNTSFEHTNSRQVDICVIPCSRQRSDSTAATHISTRFP